MANLLPAPEKLPEAGDWHKFPKVQQPDSLPMLEHWSLDTKYIEILVDKFPPFRDFMAGLDPWKDAFPEVWMRIRQLHEVRSLLYTIARWPKREESSLRLVIAGSFDKPISVRADEAGNMQLEPHPLLTAINGVEAARIRECPICGKIFWAGRIDKPACKPPCVGVLRTRRHRERYPEYKHQRYKKEEEPEARHRSQ